MNGILKALSSLTSSGAGLLVVCLFAGALAADDAYRYLAALPQKGKYQADAQRLGAMLREARLCPPAAQIDRVLAWFYLDPPGAGA